MGKGLAETANLVSIELLVAISRVGDGAALEGKLRGLNANVVGLGAPLAGVTGTYFRRPRLTFCRLKCYASHIGGGAGCQDLFDKSAPVPTTGSQGSASPSRDLIG